VGQPMRLVLHPARLYEGMVPTSFHLYHPISTTVPRREDQPCELLPSGVSEQGKPTTTTLSLREDSPSSRNPNPSTITGSPTKI
jgi:hypothetical protein